jgi:GH18 family chitinase
MGVSTDYPSIPEWVSKSEGYQTGAMVKYQGNIFYANFWASEPGVGDADHNGWRFYDELYDLTPHTPTEQAKIIAYIPTWRKKEGFNYSNDEMYQHITHGIVAFLMFSEINLGEFEPTSVSDVNAVLSEVVNTAHDNETRISIALGGATDYAFLELMSSVGNNPANPLLDKAVHNVVTFVTSHSLDGVDLDLECWWGKPGEQDQGGRPKSAGPHSAGYALTLFAQRLKQAMPDKLISATLFGTSWYGNNYDPTIAEHVDWLAIMTYDLTGSWNASPVGPHTALFKIRTQESSKIRTEEFYQESYLAEQQGEWPGGGIVNNPILSVEDTLWYWTNPLFVNWQGAGQRIPRKTIAAGVPLYGYDFAYGKDPDDLSGQVPPGYKAIRYKDILAPFPDAHTAANARIKAPGGTPRPPFISASGSYPYAHNIYFETPGTAVAKLNFLKNVGAQGVIIWELSNDIWEDGKSIIKALYNNSGNPKKLPLPTTTITWMKQLRDDTQLSGFNIPGTHETCSRYGGGLVACQSLPLKDQLEAGIRFIDIRCRHVGDGKGNDVFTIHHDLIYQNLNFGEGVRDVCIDFLKANPTECIIMSIKEEYNPDNVTRSFDATFEWYLQGTETLWYLGNTIPTLDSVRGKIVLFRRYHLDPEAQQKPQKGIIANPGAWKDNATFDIPIPGGTLKIQDEYSVPTLFNLGDKWGKIENLINEAEKGSNNDWYINFLSGTSPGAWPINVAEERIAGSYPMNPRLFDVLQSKSSGRFGTLLMDFPHDSLICRIINLNLNKEGKSLGVVPYHA